MQFARSWARALKRDLTALYLAGRDGRTPWFAKLLAVIVVAYALSPIDLIPDFIPVIGYLDDLLLVPLGILLTIRLIPADLMAEFRRRAEAMSRLPANRTAAAAIVVIWVAAAAIVGVWLWRFLETG